jgi:hypothetical protein
MGRNAVEKTEKERIALSGLTQGNRELIRIALVLPFVLVCYQVGWGAWRDAVCAAFAGFAHLLGMPVFRVAPDTFACRGHLYRFAIACTAVDAFMGSIPLLWMGQRSVWRNLAFFAEYFTALSAANLVRLAAGLWIFLHGASWWISHEAFAGVFYFALFLWIAERRGWSVPRMRETDLNRGLASSP